MLADKLVAQWRVICSPTDCAMLDRFIILTMSQGDLESDHTEDSMGTDEEEAKSLRPRKNAKPPANYQVIDFFYILLYSKYVVVLVMYERDCPSRLNVCPIYKSWDVISICVDCVHDAIGVLCA